MATMHTPGPWTVSKPTDVLHAIHGINGRIVADVGYSGTLDGDEANARLIAAAPVMLAASHEARTEPTQLTIAPQATARQRAEAEFAARSDIVEWHQNAVIFGYGGMA